jgi:hypothetical protein
MTNGLEDCASRLVAGAESPRDYQEPSKPLFIFREVRSRYCTSKWAGMHGTGRLWVS